MNKIICIYQILYYWLKRIKYQLDNYMLYFAKEKLFSYKKEFKYYNNYNSNDW